MNKGLEIELNILITGGTGFIGSTLAIALSKLNFKITLYDINKKNKFYTEYSNISFIHGDTNDTKKLVSLCKENNFDGVIHLAAVSRVVVAQNNQEECIRTNVKGTQSLLKAIELASLKNTPWLIFGSSREVYGEPKELPVLETFEKKYVNIYGDSKIQGENMFNNFAKQHNSSAIVLRFANVYGNQFDLLDRVIPRFIKAITNSTELTIEGGEQVIDFTHIDDTIDTIIKTINYISTSSQIIDDFHILPGVGWSLYDVIDYLEEHLDTKAKIKVNEKRDFDVERFIGDPTKIKNILQSRKFLDLKEGLKLAIPQYIKVMN